MEKLTFYKIRYIHKVVIARKYINKRNIIRYKERYQQKINNKIEWYQQIDNKIERYQVKEWDTKISTKDRLQDRMISTDR